MAQKRVTRSKRSRGTHKRKLQQKVLPLLTDERGAAILLDCSPSYLQKDRKTKRVIPFVMLDERFVRYVIADLEKIVAQRRVVTPEAA